MTFPDGSGARGLVYIALPGNQNWLGEAAPGDIARQIRHSVGPSGRNPDYVTDLAAALRDMGATDSHVFEVAALLAGD